MTLVLHHNTCIFETIVSATNVEGKGTVTKAGNGPCTRGILMDADAIRPPICLVALSFSKRFTEMSTGELMPLSTERGITRDVNAYFPGPHAESSSGQ